MPNILSECTFRVGGVMGWHLLIALSRHSEREVLVCCLGVLLMFCHLVVACSPEESKPKRGSFEDHFGVY